MIGGLIVGGIIDILYKTNQSLSIDEKSQKQNAKAFERQVKARQLVEEHQEKVAICLQKVANRKKGILTSR